MSVVQATFALLTGGDRYVTFGLLDRDNTPIEDVDFEVYLRAAPTPQQPQGGEILAGPLAAAFELGAPTGLGVYDVQIDLRTPA